MQDLSAYLSRSIELSELAKAAGDHPFGAVLVVDGQIAIEAQNRVNTDNDITAHAETMLVRVAQQAGQLEAFQHGTVYTSCEPCPMCVGALYWAGARHVVFGLSSGRLNDIANAKAKANANGDTDGVGVGGFTISATTIGAQANPPLIIEGPFQEAKAEAPHLGFWKDRSGI